MSKKSYPRGEEGEREAAKYLKKKGYKIIERNWRRRWGEIDIVALEGDCLVFVEVKTRFGEEYGRPEEAMTPWKIRSLIKSARYYKMLHPELPDALRIDFVGIIMKGDKVSEINLIKNITN